MKQILNEILEDLIIEKIERDLREVINEELGVATEVTILKSELPLPKGRGFRHC